MLFPSPVVKFGKYNMYFSTPFASMVLRNDNSTSEGDNKWLTHIKREPHILHIKDTLVDFEKGQANAAIRQHLHPQSGKRLI